MALPPMPDDALGVADALRRGLDRALGDAFASLFLYGELAFPRPARWHVDFDFDVLSNYHAAEWALVSLADTWHDAIRAAMRLYSRTATDHDTRTLEREWPRFVAFVNELLPTT